MAMTMTLMASNINITVTIISIQALPDLALHPSVDSEILTANRIKLYEATPIQKKNKKKK